MAVLVLGTLAVRLRGSDCQTPVPVSCCVGGCGGNHPHSRGVRAVGAELSDRVGGARGLSLHAPVLPGRGDAMSPARGTRNGQRGGGPSTSGDRAGGALPDGGRGLRPLLLPGDRRVLPARGARPRAVAVGGGVARTAERGALPPAAARRRRLSLPRCRRPAVHGLRHRPLGCRTFFCHRRQGPAHEPVAEMDRLQRRLESVARRLNPMRRARALSAIGTPRPRRRQAIDLTLGQPPPPDPIPDFIPQ